MLETIKLHTIYKVIRFFPFAFFLLNFTIPLLGIESEISKKVNWPLEMRLPISGSFAEYRNSHLHMGCDFKTYGINGFPVLSVFDGFVSNMSYSEFGYGLSIILSSPSLNLNARYAHLNDLNGDATGLEELNHSLR
jgi:murein DD-endopeptidase MepM/ murein hydrolase activator NlpD